MKLPALLLAGSLAANALLLALHFVSPLAPSPGNNGVATSPSILPSEPTTDPADLAHLAALWPRIQTADLRTLTDHLRTAGFPPRAIRALIADRLSEQFAARREALIAQQEVRPFWKPAQRMWAEPRIEAALAELQLEHDRILRATLGRDAGLPDDGQSPWQRAQYSSLPLEKREQVKSLAADYFALRLKVDAETKGGSLSAEGRDALRLLEVEQRADLAKILSPVELENYELRSTPTSHRLRESLRAFEPDEHEFREIFRLVRAAEARHGSSEERNNRPPIAADIQVGAAALLGPDRYEKFRRTTYFGP